MVPDVSKEFDTFILKRKGQTLKKTAVLEDSDICHVCGAVEPTLLGVRSHRIKRLGLETYNLSSALTGSIGSTYTTPQVLIARNFIKLMDSFTLISACLSFRFLCSLLSSICHIFN